MPEARIAVVHYHLRPGGVTLDWLRSTDACTAALNFYPCTFDPSDVPFEQLGARHRRLVMHGTGEQWFEVTVDVVAGLPTAPPSPQGSLAADTVAPPVSSTEPPAPKTLRIEVDATEKCWVSIERDGTSVLQKNMEPGETQSFEAVEKFQLTVGNAGGVHLKINGKSAKPLGKPGSVVKLLIDRKNLQDFLDQTAGYYSSHTFRLLF